MWIILKDAGSQWLEDKAARLGAALAYYTVFSLAPLLLIVIAIAGLIFGQQAAQGLIVGQIQDLVGEEGGKAIEAMIANADRPSSGILAIVIGVAMLLFGAMGVFGQLQDALNTIWEVQPKPGRGLLGLLKDRLLSFSMVLGVAFLLLVSLVVSAGLTALGSLLGEGQSGLLGQSVNWVVSFGVITLLFAMIYRFLPDAKVAWKDVWLGAAITALPVHRRQMVARTVPGSRQCGIGVRGGGIAGRPVGVALLLRSDFPFQGRVDEGLCEPLRLPDCSQ